jgi:hypothetical protein
MNDAQILMQHKHRMMLQLFRTVLTTCAKPRRTRKAPHLDITASADFYQDFSFHITVFNEGDNVTLTIYDFWPIEQSTRLVKRFLKLALLGNFDKLAEAPRRPTKED